MKSTQTTPTSRLLLVLLMAVLAGDYLGSAAGWLGLVNLQPIQASCLVSDAQVLGPSSTPSRTPFRPCYLYANGDYAHTRTPTPTCDPHRHAYFHAYRDSHSHPTTPASAASDPCRMKPPLPNWSAMHRAWG